MLHIAVRLRRGHRLRRGRDQGRAAARAGRQDPDLAHVVLLEGAGGGDRSGAVAGRPGRARPRAAGREPDGGRHGRRRHRAGPPGHADLHLGHHRPAQGRRADPRQLDLRGRRRSTELGILRPDDLQYLWLPLSHSFGKVLLAAQLQIGFATAVDGRIDKIVENLAVVRPTFMAGAPRIFEKVHNGSSPRSRREGGIKAKLFDWAFGIGRKGRRPQQQGRSPGRRWPSQHAVADKAGAARSCGSGSAAGSGSSSPAARRCPARSPSGSTRPACSILEGYGLTESSAAHLRQPARTGSGSARSAPPLPGTELRIAEDGEMLIRGPRRHARLPRPAGGDRGVARRRRLAAHRRHRRARRRRVPADHRPQEGPDQDLRRQVRRAAADRGRRSRRSAGWPASSSCTATGATT